MRHSTNLQWSQLKVGLVVTVSVSIIVVAVVSFGYLSEVLKPKRVLHAVFSDVRGLRGGAPVWLGGVETGYVKGIRFPTTGEKVVIEVEMVVAADMASLIRSDSTASIRTQGLLGDIYVEIALGSPSAPPLPPDQPLEGIVPIDFKELVSGSSITLGELGRVLRNVNGMLTKIAEGEGSIGRFVNDPTLYEELTKLSIESRSLVSELEKGEGAIGKLLTDSTLYDRLTATADRFESAVASFEQLGEELRHGEGTVGKLTSDPTVYDNLVGATGRLDRLLARVEAGDGLAGQMVTGQELLGELRVAIAEFTSASTELRTLLEDVREHPKKYFRFSLF